MKRKYIENEKIKTKNEMKTNQERKDVPDVLQNTSLGDADDGYN